MAQNVDIALEAVIADARSVFQRVERDQETVTVLHFGEPVAVITPAPIAKTITASSWRIRQRTRSTST